MNDILKMHASIYCVTDPIHLREIRGIVYTTGFNIGDIGYSINTSNGMVTKLEVTRVYTYPLNALDSQDISYFKHISEYMGAEFIFENVLHFVYFKAIDRDETHSIPAHEILSIS